MTTQIGSMTPSSATPSSTTPRPDFSAVKAKQQAAWSAGNYAVVGTTLQIVGESLCEAANVRPVERVLDVAAGNGNASLAAARRFAEVTSTDYVESLLAQGKTRAAAEGLPIEFRYADAEDLPFADATFDAVLSTFGVMFTPDPSRAAAEMLRVCRPGGRIGLASWTPASMIGRLFSTLGKYLPPAPGLRSPALWGTEARLDELFGGEAATVTATERTFVFRYRSPAHWIEVFRTYYGPVQKAFAALGPQDQEALERDLLALLADCNRDDVTLVAPSAYLEAIIVRR
jgi:SAM-dependent methyltransferase